MKKDGVLNVRNMVVIAMFGALASVLMFFQIPVPFAPPFYKIDFCEVPALIGSFALGPVAGVLIEFLKIVIKIITQGTTTMYVGELGNFLGGIAFVIPAGLIYQRKRTKKNAYVALGVSVIIMVAWSIIGNVFITLPFYGRVAFDGIENIIAMGTAVNANITNLFTFVVFAIVPFNLLKGTIVAMVTAIIYKKVSVIFKLTVPTTKKVVKEGVE